MWAVWSRKACHAFGSDDRRNVEGSWRKRGIETARLDARLLACHGLGLSETDIILQFDRALQSDEIRLLDGLVERRLTREPIAHILGYREFWGLPFKVTADTLVPRPDM